MDFVSDSAPKDAHDCISDFGLTVKVTGISMVFEFDQWLEVESNQVVEEWGMGQFTLSNMTFTLHTLPYVHQEKFRVKIKDKQLHIGDYFYNLHVKENSRFDETLSQFSALFAEQMKNQLNADLSNQLASAIQKGAHSYFRRVQANNKLPTRDIYLNKHLTSLCYI